MAPLLVPAPVGATTDRAVVAGDDLIVRRPARDRRDATVVFAAAVVVYLLAGWNLAVRHHAIVGDAMARVANAYYVGYSRDPHLAAVGFVWNPLPSFVELPLLTLHPVFPALRTQGLAGNVTSAVFMAGAAAVVVSILRRMDVGRTWRFLLVGVFALHPLTLLYGANGDSEASLVFFLALSCLALLAWFQERTLRSLVLLGVALALGYLSRQEFLLAGVLAVTAVGIETYRTAAERGAFRRWAAATEATVAALPFVFAIAAWATAAWILVGTAFSYLEVNREQVAGARVGIDLAVGGTGAFARLGYVGEQLLRIEPAAVLILGGAVVVALRRRDTRIVAPLVTFGAVVATQVGLFAAGSTFGWLRFSITEVPLTVIAAGFLLAPARAGLRTGVRTATAAALVLGLLVALPIAAGAMRDPRLGREEAGLVGLLPGYGFAGQSHRGAYAPGDYEGFAVAADYFDRLRLRRGAVLVDAQYSFPLILKSDRPQQFVIPSDRDFERTLADPATYRARYLLVSDSASDLVAASYPELRSARRTPTARLIRTFRAGPNRLRLYAVTASVTGQPAGSARG